MPRTSDDKLKAVLTEYEILKREAMERVKLQLQVYPIALSAISLVFGYVIINEKYEALLLVPFITILLAYRWIWDVQMVDTYRQYLIGIENEKIPKLIGSFGQAKGKKPSLFVGWQSHYERWRVEHQKSWLISAFLLLGIPTLVSILYYIWFLKIRISIDSLGRIVEFPYLWYLLATIVYPLLSFHVLWIGYETWRKRKQVNE